MSHNYQTLGNDDQQNARRIKEDGSVINMADLWDSTFDVFSKLIADGTNNVLDIGSHYSYNPERWRLLVDGTRVFPEYDSVSQYSHGGDVHELKPAAGETVVLETNELPRYVVQYEQLASFAFNVNQSLQSGDIARFGPFGDQDGWFFEHNGSHNDKQCDLVIRRAGSEAKRVEDLDLKESILSWKMYRTKYSWYNVGPANWQEFYAKDNKGIISDVGAIALEGTSRGPEKGNVPLRYEITASESTTGLQMNAGSVALVVQGSTEPRTRGKSHKFEDSIPLSNADVWQPIRAFQVKPERSIVNCALLSFDITNYGADADVEVAAIVMPNEKVSFGSDGWSTPTLWNTTNNAIETRTDITEVCDSNGDAVTDFSTLTNPGGFLVGRSALELLGNQLQQGTSVSQRQTIKRNIPNLDYVIVFGNSGNGSTATYEPEFEQDF